MFTLNRPISVTLAPARTLIRKKKWQKEAAHRQESVGAIREEQKRNPKRINNNTYWTTIYLASWTVTVAAKERRWSTTCREFVSSISPFWTCFSHIPRELVPARKSSLVYNAAGAARLRIIVLLKTPGVLAVISATFSQLRASSPRRTYGLQNITTHETSLATYTCITHWFQQ